MFQVYLKRKIYWVSTQDNNDGIFLNSGEDLIKRLPIEFKNNSDLRIKSIKICVFLLLSNDFHWPFEARLLNNVVVRCDYNVKGPGIDIAETEELLTEQRKPNKIKFERSFESKESFENKFILDLVKVSHLHLEINSKYNVYANNCRYYSLLIYDYFACREFFGYDDNFEQIKKFLLLAREYHYCFNHFEIPTKSILNEDGEKAIKEMKEINNEAALKLQSIYDIE